MCFKIFAAGTYRSVISTLRKWQKAQFVLSFFEVLTHFLRQNMVDFSSRSESDVFCSCKGIPVKNHWFYSLHQNCCSPKIPKFSIDFDSFRYSISFFLVITEMISSTNVSIKKFAFVEKNLIEKSFFRSWHQKRYSMRIPNSATFFDLSGSSNSCFSIQ